MALKKKPLTAKPSFKTRRQKRSNQKAEQKMLRNQGNRKGR